METSGWTTVRCLFRLSHDDGTFTYEERMTLWRTADAEEAIAWAEAEAQEYGTAPGVSEPGRWEYLGLAQSYLLRDDVGHGAEVFSLLRDSALEPTAYLDAFFDTGGERQQTWNEAMDRRLN